MRRWMKQGRVWLAISAVGGSTFVLEGCDPTVRDTVLSGVESSATSLFSSFIQAFFESLAAEDEGAATVV